MRSYSPDLEKQICNSHALQFCQSSSVHIINLILKHLYLGFSKNLPAMWETWVRCLGWEDPLEESMATHSSILAWRIPTDRVACWATAQGVTKSQT